MICPNCKTDSIPFFPVWIKGSFGRIVCPNCKTVTRLKKTTPVIISSALIGLAVGIALAGFWFGLFGDFGWSIWQTLAVIAAILLVALVIDGVKDYWLIEVEAVREESAQSVK